MMPHVIQDSFNGAKSWVKELQRRGDANVVIALAGNKADMENKRKVQTEEAQQYAKDSDIGYCFFSYCVLVVGVLRVLHRGIFILYICYVCVGLTTLCVYS